MSRVKNEQDPDGLQVYMISDTPMGAYYHYCTQLCNALVECPEIKEVRLLALFEDRKQPGVPPEERVLLDSRIKLEVMGPTGRSRIWRRLAFFRNLFRHLRQVSRSSWSVIHFQTLTGFQILDTILLIIYRIMGIPMVRSVHETTAAERIRIPSCFEQWVGRWQIKLVDALIVHDAGTGQRIQNFLGEKPITVIPHGNYLVFRSFMPKGIEAILPKQDPPVALFLGIKRHKGLEVFIEALRQLQDMRFPMKAVIAGRINPGDEDLIEAIRSLLMAEIRPGYISNTEIWKIYKECDFVVLPYLRGTTSGAVHLAYAFKRPVIVSNLECFHELVIDEKTGLVIPKGDAAALAKAMIHLCERQSDRIRMGEEGFRLASDQQYRWEEISGRTAQVYSNILYQKRTRKMQKFMDGG